MGADIGTLVRVLFRAGPLARSGRALAAAALGSAIGRLPFTWTERAWASLRLRARQSPAPVFIVGHWRSGTTHLYNLLSRDPRFGYVTPVATGLPWDFLLLGSLLRPLLDRVMPGERFIDRIPVTPDAPQEDEIALASMQTLSFYHGIYFPSRLTEEFNRGVFFDDAGDAEVQRWCRRMRHFVGKIALRQPGRRLLIKNPVYTARVALLRELFPDARFIHIHRNPYAVFQSTRNFYAKLLPEFALQPYDPALIDELILSSYPRMLDTLIRDLEGTPANRAIEVSFDELEQDPMGLVERIYGALELDGFDGVRPELERYLESIAGYRKNAYDFPESDNRAVSARWGRFIDRWGYTAPTATE